MPTDNIQINETGTLIVVYNEDVVDTATAGSVTSVSGVGYEQPTTAVVFADVARLVTTEDIVAQVQAANVSDVKYKVDGTSYVVLADSLQYNARAGFGWTDSLFAKAASGPAASAYAEARLAATSALTPPHVSPVAAEETCIFAGVSVPATVAQLTSNATAVSGVTHDWWAFAGSSVTCTSDVHVAMPVNTSSAANAASLVTVVGDFNTAIAVSRNIAMASTVWQAWAELTDALVASEVVEEAGYVYTVSAAVEVSTVDAVSKIIENVDEEAVFASAMHKYTAPSVVTGVFGSSDAHGGARANFDIQSFALHSSRTTLHSHTNALALSWMNSRSSARPVSYVALTSEALQSSLVEAHGVVVPVSKATHTAALTAALATNISTAAHVSDTFKVFQSHVIQDTLHSSASVANSVSHVVYVVDTLYGRTDVIPTPQPSVTVSSSATVHSQTTTVGSVLATATAIVAAEAYSNLSALVAEHALAVSGTTSSASGSTDTQSAASTQTHITIAGGAQVTSAATSYASSVLSSYQRLLSKAVSADVTAGSVHRTIEAESHAVVSSDGHPYWGVVVAGRGTAASDAKVGVRL